MTRLLVVAHAATPGTRELVFGDASQVARPEHISPLEGHTAAWLAAPEPACTTTAAALGAVPSSAAVDCRISRDYAAGSGTQSLAVVPELVGPNFGRWRRRSLAEVGAEEPAGVQAWLGDPAAVPHGGECLAGLVARIGAWADAWAWSEGRSVAVVTPLVARALAVHALGAPAEVIFRLDVAPLGRVYLTRSSAGWHLRLG